MDVNDANDVPNRGVVQAKRRVKILRRVVGCSIQPLHAVGAGVADLLCGYRGVNLILEIKEGKKPPSARKLTRDQNEWIGNWRGTVCIVNNVDEALAVFGFAPHRTRLRPIAKGTANAINVNAYGSGTSEISTSNTPPDVMV